MEPLTLYHRAQDLVQQLANGCESHLLGSATVSIYDTAWVSMISRTINGHDEWLFPESFQYILDHQLPEGSWESYASLEDGILNTMAALLALKKHSNALSAGDKAISLHLDVSIYKAKRCLEDKLHRWDVESGVNVGFEILIPAMLAMLETEDIIFRFPGQACLQVIRERKMANFDPRILYDAPTTFLHSLEAFIGSIDFDRLCQYKTLGSMMCSPASTAVYLMHTSRWDAEAESYLHRVISEGYGKGGGGVPSVFPMPVFEITWVISTLFRANFSTDTMGPQQLRVITAYLETHFQKQGGLLGFAPAVVPDADDTAKTLNALHQLGRPAEPTHLISHFRSKHNHFCTYPGERDTSFSANCNVLQALLCSIDIQTHLSHITKIAVFLCDAWWSGTARDKWNISFQYSMMLLAETLIRLLELCDESVLHLSPTLLQERMPVVLIQIVNRTLLTQSDVGTWDDEKSPEVTAYGVLTLRALSSLPWLITIKERINFAIEAGQQWLIQSKDNWKQPQHLWIEKVTYGSGRLSEAYCLAAMSPFLSSHVWSEQISGLVKSSQKLGSKISTMVSKIDTYHDQPSWKLNAVVIEGTAFLPLLKSTRMDILPRQKEAKNEYLDLIPCIWVLVNNYKGLFNQANLLWDMMVVTLCNFRVDEYMETVVARIRDERFEQIKVAIISLCSYEENHRGQSGNNPHEDFTAEWEASVEVGQTDAAANSRSASGFNADIGHYVGQMLGFSRIQRASSTDKKHLHSELRSFLLSHIAQIEDNSRFSLQEPQWNSQIDIFTSPRTSYYTWAHTIGAESVSSPFSFAFFCCLLGATTSPSTGPKDCFPSVFEKHLARDLSGHLAVMSRLYNDYGSLERDRLEANINSVNFPEFHNAYYLGHDTSGSGSSNEINKTHKLKEDLLALAQYERCSAESAGNKLLDTLRTSGLRKDRAKADGVELFIGVAALYADIYVAKDLSNHVEIGPP